MDDLGMSKQEQKDLRKKMEDAKPVEYNKLCDHINHCDARAVNHHCKTHSIKTIEGSRKCESFT